MMMSDDKDEKEVLEAGGAELKELPDDAFEEEWTDEDEPLVAGKDDDGKSAFGDDGTEE